MSIKPTYQSRLYRDFLALAPQNYHGLIRFYEEREVEIGHLGADEQYDMLFAFTNALFEVGAYRQFLAIVDQAIVVSLDGDYQDEEVDKDALFEQLLFRKAAAHLQTLQYAKAEHCARELLRIHPDHEMAAMLFRKTLRLQDTSITRRTRAAAILLIALSAMVILVEVLVIRPFYHMYTEQVELSRNLIFLFGLLTLGIGELITFWRARQRCEAFISAKR